ncbi:MAG: recombinase family protein [Anaerolineae bacterium]|nr:recombinase family protein [Anaerolineae bacterium]
MVEKRAVLYARVSSDDRKKTGGENLKDQIEMGRGYCQTNGYMVVAEMQEDDRGASGADWELPELAKALELAYEGRFDVFVVRELDRLARDLAKQVIVERELKKTGVAIEYVLYDFPDTPEGRLNKHFHAMMAEYEREKIRQRMTRGKIRELKKGNLINHGHSPLGYRTVKVNDLHTLEIDEEEANIVREIFNLYLNGDGESGPMSIRAIAKRLTELKVPSYSDRRQKPDCTKRTATEAGTWGDSSISFILSNETYTGVWYYGKRRWPKDEWIAFDVPVIIDKKTWLAAQRKREKGRIKSIRNRKYEYLLGSRVRCLACGRVMISSSSRNGQGYLFLRYRCQAQKRRFPCDAGNTSYSSKKIDQVAWEWVVGLLNEPEQLAKGLMSYQAEQDKLTEPLRNRQSAILDCLQQNKRHLSRLFDLYLDADFDKAMFAAKRQELEKTNASLTIELERLTKLIEHQAITDAQITDLVTFAETVRKRLDQATSFKRKREIIDLLDVTAELGVENGEKVVYLHCILSSSAICIQHNQ